MIALKKTDFVNECISFPVDILGKVFRGVDVTVTSPPYNLSKEYGDGNLDNMAMSDYYEWSFRWMRSVHEITNVGGRMCLNIPLDKNLDGAKPIYKDLLDIAMRIGWNYHTTIVWNEQNISRRTAWGSWRSASAPYVISPVEMIVVLYKGNSWRRESFLKKSTISRDDFIAWTNGVWTFPGEKKTRVGHPAPFPLELPKRCIELFSFSDDVIFDPFVGSGTTLIAAANSGRHAIGCEIEQKYIDISICRISKECKDSAILIL